MKAEAGPREAAVMDRPRTKQDLVIRSVGQQHEAAATVLVDRGFAHVVQHPDPFHTMLRYLVENPVDEMLKNA